MSSYVTFVMPAPLLCVGPSGAACTVGRAQAGPWLGGLMRTGFESMMSGRYWISFLPGIAVLLTIVSINLVGDQLRDVLNPRLKK